MPAISDLTVSGWSSCEKHHEVGGVTIDTGSIPGKTPPDADHNLQRGIEPCRD